MNEKSTLQIAKDFFNLFCGLFKSQFVLEKWLTKEVTYLLIRNCTVEKDKFLDWVHLPDCFSILAKTCDLPFASNDGKSANASFSSQHKHGKNNNTMISRFIEVIEDTKVLTLLDEKGCDAEEQRVRTQSPNMKVIKRQ